MKILVVDAYNMIHRARHSFIKGENATTFCFFRSLKSEIDRHCPDLVYVVLEGHPKHRFSINPDYKATRPREVDEEFQCQKRNIISAFNSLPVVVLRHPDYECDDVIGHVCTEMHPDDEVVVISTDTDFIQLLERENVSLWNPIKKKFVERWSVNYVDWKSLKGDTADNIKGLKGIGTKRAYTICENAETLENFLSGDPNRRAQFENAKSQILFADIPLGSKTMEVATCRFDEKNIKTVFTAYNFKSIIGNAWPKWKHTMETLDEKLEQYSYRRSTS